MFTYREHSQGFVYQAAVIIGALTALASLVGIHATLEPKADIRLEPHTARVSTDEVFSVSVIVSSEVPANVFSGEIHFDPAILQVETIAYNTSIASLWAEKPWYENGEGTIHFAGGSTMPGGFEGEGSLLTIAFRSLQPSITTLKFLNGRILAHDGLGSDVSIRNPIDAVFTIDAASLEAETLSAPTSRASIVAVSDTEPSTDLNSDGKQNVVDLSIFMLNMLGTDLRYDFNQDGRITITDLSILMNAR